MPHSVDAATFLALRDAGLPVLDARSPSEFAAGRIPGSRNLPVLSDDERAAVGTAHARSGAEGAVHLALQLAGPQLAGKLARARRLFQDHLDGRHAEAGPPPVAPPDSLAGRALAAAVESASLPADLPLENGRIAMRSLRKTRDVLIHCWRGGMRSGSLAWLLETGGFRVHVLQGGYKAYRNLVRAELALSPAPVLVLGGMTGSGKTDILHELAARGSQVLDLEGLARHRGSAFGGVGLPDQPGNEEMENALHDLWRRLDPARPVWLEDEDRRIGSVSLCGEFFEHIRKGRLVLAEAPFHRRADRLTRMYTGAPHREELEACVERLRRRLGDETSRLCIRALRESRYHEAVTAVLGYYDRLYQRQIDKHARTVALRLPLDDDDPRKAAGILGAAESSLF